MIFLNEFAALREIKTMLAETDRAKLAVAFWGAGAIERLELNRSGLNLEILCNLDSGACNPEELRKMLDHPGITLKSHPSLHAKVWWTSTAAIVGSSNASTNGLALECEAGNGWHEANVRINDTRALDGICIWFDDLFKAGYRIKLADLDHAQTLWNARKRIAPTGMRLARTLFDAYRSSPDNPVWQRVKIIYWCDHLDKKHQNWIDTEVNEGRISCNISAYGECENKILSNDYVLDFNIESENPVYNGIWKALPLGVHPTSLRLVRKINLLSLSAFGRFKISDIEEAALSGIATSTIRQHSVDGRNAIITFPQAMTLIDAHSSVF